MLRRRSRRPVQSPPPRRGCSSRGGFRKEDKRKPGRGRTHKEQAVALANKAKQDLKDAVSNEKKVVGKKEMLDKAVAAEERQWRRRWRCRRIKVAQQRTARLSQLRSPRAKRVGSSNSLIRSRVSLSKQNTRILCRFFQTDGDTNAMGMCAVTPEGKCPAVWNETRCVKLQPVKTSVFETPTTPLW